MACQCSLGVWGAVAAMLAGLLTAGCGRPPKPAQESNAAHTSQETTRIVEREQDEATRREWRKRAGPELSGLLDREFGEWEMLSLQQLEGTYFAMIHVLDPNALRYYWVAVSPTYQFVAKQSAMAHGVELNGLYDVDGDGHKEAAFWIWSGGDAGLDTCLFIKLRPEPRVLGGNDFCPVDCGRPRDVDRDGRIEFEARDLSFGSRGVNLTVPLIYGYRGGRFVDLTASLGRDQLREAIAASRKQLRALAKGTRPLEGAGGHVHLRKWYACARLLGEEETTILNEMSANAPRRLLDVFMDDLPLFRDTLDSRNDRFFGPESLDASGA